MTGGEALTALSESTKAKDEFRVEHTLMRTETNASAASAGRVPSARRSATVRMCSPRSSSAWRRQSSQPSTHAVERRRRGRVRRGVGIGEPWG